MVSIATVELRGISKVHPDGFPAVRSVDVHIDDGEFFVVIGPSGCGKSTLLRVIAGLESATTGDVLVGGERVNDVPTHRRDLSMLFQSSALYPHLTVRENLAFPLRMAHRHQREIAAAVTAMAQVLSVTDVLDRRPHRLSGGQRQRVAMGRAIIRGPELLLMDEPMSNLDAKLRTELRSELSAIQRRLGATAIYVTHDQVEAMSLGHRIAVMRDGRIVQCATPIELYHAPQDVYVAQLLGNPPMNCLLGRVLERNGAPIVSLGSSVVDLGDHAARWPDLRRWIGREIVVGVRAEAWRVDERSDLLVEIARVEHLGSEQLVYATAPVGWVATNHLGSVVAADERASTIVASVGAGVEANMWRPVRLGIDPAQLHLFEPGSGRRLISIPVHHDRRLSTVGAPS